MWAPKRPVFTVIAVPAISTNRLKNFSPSWGEAALEKLGRAPLLVSAASVN